MSTSEFDPELDDRRSIIDRRVLEDHTVNVDAYVDLLRAILTRETGRWRYRMWAIKWTPDRTHLAVRVCCERYLWAVKDWEQVEIWTDWYRRHSEGEILYRFNRYKLIRTLDPWHESTRETTTWPEAMVRRRRQDAAFLQQMRTIRTKPGRRPHAITLLRHEP